MGEIHELFVLALSLVWFAGATPVSARFLQFRRVTIRGAQPSARLSEEICLSEGSARVYQRALRGLFEGSAGSLRGFCGALGGPRDFPRFFGGSGPMLKNLLMPLFLMGCFPVDFQDVKRPLRTKSVKRPIKVGKRPINEGKRPIKAKVLVGVSVGSLISCFTAPPSWRKTAPLKRPIKRSMICL